MSQPKNEIVNWEEKVIALMSQLEGKGRADSAQQITDLFNLHNDRFMPFETGRSCGACRQRVYNKMREYYVFNLRDNGTSTGEENKIVL